MINSLYIDNYRSVRNLAIDLERLNVVFGPNGCGKSNIYKAIHLIHGAATGQLSRWLSEEGGIQKAMWAGDRAKGYANTPRRIRLAVETDDFEYELQVGFPDKLPYPTMFELDPVVKEEQIWLSGFRRRPSSSIMQRRNQTVFLHDVNGEKVTHAATLLENESLFGQLGEPHLYPEVSSARETLRNWRFYHEFAISRGAGLRLPQVGYRSPILGGDGLNLAAAFQTIVEIGDGELLFAVLEEAFPECVFFCDNSGGRFQMMMNRQGINRPLESAEFSDGTLRFLCLAVALLSPRPPRFIALNEPENSLHPRMLPALARLIAQASRYTQIWLTSHSPELARLIEAHTSFTLYQLSIEHGETRVNRLA
ncbi:AAA family ATPase [Dryocola sp. BD613]|uniref:AAA family ATPase n=1 Tax=Dryocola sp. BD613 TaxID=3133272 RepID=UPI003F5020B1